MTLAVEHRSIETNGIRLHCAVAGAGPLVILLHGFPECWYSWRHQIPILARRFRVVAPDLRGYGDSDKPRPVAAYALRELLADVRGLIGAFGERDAIIVGHDWGGIIAWSFAMEHPESTRRLVVMNCPHPALFVRHLRTNRRQRLRSWYFLWFQIPWLPETLLRAFGAWVVGRIIRDTSVRRDTIDDEDLTTLRAAACRPGALRSAVNYYRAIVREPFAHGAWAPAIRRFVHGSRRIPDQRLELGHWPPITAPTLLIWGEQDPFLGVELSRGTEPLMAGPFETKYLPLAGHFVQQEQPEVVNGHLLDFLRDVPAEAAGATG